MSARSTITTADAGRMEEGDAPSGPRIAPSRSGAANHGARARVCECLISARLPMRVLAPTDWRDLSLRAPPDGPATPARPRLRQVAQALQAQLRRAGDFCARYGGEEFVLVLPSTAGSAVSTYAEELRQVVIALNIRHPSNASGVVTISLGVATADRVCPDPETLVQHADQALYLAKQQGRNRVEIHRAWAAGARHAR